MFFVDHQALLYLVNEPCNIGRIVRWFLILLELDFIMVVKKGKTHLRVDHLSRLTNGEKPERINDKLLETYLFTIEMVPKWFEETVSLMSIGNFKKVPARLVENSKP